MDFLRKALFISAAAVIAAASLSGCAESRKTDDGRLRRLPVMSEDYLEDYTADEYLKEEEDENFRILMPYDCPRRDSIIKENITEWVVNQGCVDGSTIVEAVCAVVSLLVEYGMWKDEYAKCIDIKKIKEEYGEE